ncbi:WYL domain-containing protein [Kitasatospora sp. DSM 101779]|uniref:WYL domain-containing protein n=1 Tax=Kitasatospora sp. DSM 101779 TaxID=2853165 RepID=UPI0021DAA6A3|nr:WYL domain-containing protein [Kitasatospora sp. DSM 101779]MCU7823916.1 hypothetical protein [Kitasatospora sp. DSM 101779]
MAPSARRRAPPGRHAVRRRDPRGATARRARPRGPDPWDGRAYSTDTEEIIAGHACNLSFTDVRQLAHAVDAGLAITIEYVAASGSATVRTLNRIDLDAAHLYAWCHLRNDERVFTISRIRGVMPV